jgi:hypothetical protein
MKNFTFKILDRHPRLTHKVPYTIGQITINDFEEEFVMPIDWWQVADYERQWEESFKYLKDMGKSYFITKIFKPERGFQYIDRWIAHTIDNKIKIQNKVVFNKQTYKKAFNNEKVTLENWYKFIPSYTQPKLLFDVFIASEWTVDIEE